MRVYAIRTSVRRPRWRQLIAAPPASSRRSPLPGSTTTSRPDPMSPLTSARRRPSGDQTGRRSEVLAPRRRRSVPSAFITATDPESRKASRVPSGDHEGAAPAPRSVSKPVSGSTATRPPPWLATTIAPLPEPAGTAEAVSVTAAASVVATTSERRRGVMTPTLRLDCEAPMFAPRRKCEHVLAILRIPPAQGRAPLSQAANTALIAQTRSARYLGAWPMWCSSTASTAGAPSARRRETRPPTPRRWTPTRASSRLVAELLTPSVANLRVSRRVRGGGPSRPGQRGRDHAGRLPADVGARRRALPFGAGVVRRRRDLVRDSGRGPLRPAAVLALTALGLPLHSACGSGR